jgi:hypothetical protein
VSSAPSVVSPRQPDLDRGVVAGPAGQHQLAVGLLHQGVGDVDLAADPDRAGAVAAEAGIEAAVDVQPGDRERDLAAHPLRIDEAGAAGDDDLAVPLDQQPLRGAAQRTLARDGCVRIDADRAAASEAGVDGCRRR